MSLFLPGTDTLFESGLDNLIQHMRTNAVVAGCQVIAHAAPDMGVRVGAGSIQGLGLVVAVAQTDLVVAAAAANPRLDLVHVDMTTGVPAIIAGAPAATPKPPALPANSIELGIVGVGVGAVNIQAGNIGDRRLIAQAGASFQNFVAIGGTPRAGAGAVRLPNNSGLIAARNAGNTQDIGLMYLDAANAIQIGAGGGALPSSVILNALLQVPLTQFIYFGGNAILYADNSNAIIRGGNSGLNDLIVGAGYISVGATPATAGAVRVPNGGAVTSRNAANTANYNLAYLTASDTVNIGNGAAGVVLEPIYVSVSSPAATAGAVRLTNNALMEWRNVANTGNVVGLSVDASDRVALGNGGAAVIIANNIVIDASAGTIVTSSGTWNLGLGGTAPALSGTLRLNNTNSIQWRNGANTGDVGSISVLATNELQLGDAVNPVRLNAGAGTVDFRYAVTALGGGAAPTLGTIGGTGPATAAQNSWLKILINGTASFLAVWR